MNTLMPTYLNMLKTLNIKLINFILSKLIEHNIYMWALSGISDLDSQ